MNELMSAIWSTLKTFEFKDAVDILIISLLLYYLFKLFRQSRAGQLVKGVGRETVEAAFLVERYQSGAFRT